MNRYLRQLIFLVATPPLFVSFCLGWHNPAILPTAAESVIYTLILLLSGISLIVVWPLIPSSWRRWRAKGGKTTLLHVLLLPLMLCHMAGASEADLPRSVERVLDRYEDAVTDAQEDLAEALAKARKTAIKDLDSELDKVTRRGDLETALAIKARVDELKAEQAEAEEALMLGKKQAAAAPTTMERLLTSHKWGDGRVVLTFSDDGTFTSTGAWATAGWEWKDQKLYLRFTNGVVRTKSFDQEKLVLVDDGNGRDYYMVK